MKRIDKSYRWQKTTIVDRRSDFLAFLETNPTYEDALAYRKIELKRLSWIIDETKQGKPPRKEMSLFNLKPEPRLRLVE